MSNSISGVVKNGVVIPDSLLPQGARVQILLALDIPPQLQQELTAWQQGSADAVALVERLADSTAAKATEP